MARAFKVALNPRNPEAASWYDPVTSVNLFLGEVKDIKGNVVSGPISNDLSKYDTSQLKAVIKGINAGLLIVVEGDLPAGVELEKIPVFRSPRSRWVNQDADGSTNDKLVSREADAIASWEALVARAEAKSTAVKV